MASEKTSQGRTPRETSFQAGKNISDQGSGTHQSFHIQDHGISRPLQVFDVEAEKAVHGPDCGS